MKKKILLLTTIYPAPDLKYGTPSIHYFTKEWVKMGYDVKVIHYQAVYPRFFYLLAKMFRELIASRTGAVVFTERDNEDKQYIMEGVSVHRLPIFKRIPHAGFTKSVIKKHILKINKIDEFTPDIVIGHFSNPQLEIINELKTIYNARTCMIMHDSGDSIKRIYKKNYQTYMSSVDIWGFRSVPIKNKFESNFGKQKQSFLCYSGIPEDYITLNNNRSFYSGLSDFVYVGEFIDRKHPVAIIDAVHSVYSDKDYHISYIGRGAGVSSINEITKSLNIQNNISVLGFIPRNEIRNVLDKSDCMVMISSGETFGLVYLEAMGRGCITIGSRNEGIDGVIRHGFNGFLCEAGNSVELANLILHINSLSPEQRKQISQNAISTVKELTDFKAAHKYITAVDY